MRLDRKTFFAYARRAPFGNRLSRQQVEGLDALLDEWDSGRYGRDARHFSNVCAQVFHETGGRMSPVREGFAASDAEARRVVAQRRYGKRDAGTGHVYYGRGAIQLTWAENYRRLGKALELRLYEQPDLALDLRTSALIALKGMAEGLFTGKKLADFFNDAEDDPVGARAIVNGRDKAALVASYHAQFLGAVTAADLSSPRPADVSTRAAQPDDVRPVESAGVLSALAAFMAAGGTGLVAAVNNPWAALTLVCLSLMALAVAWLVSSGRLQVTRRTVP
ncbi:glycoside hydrolase family 19 protein [Terrihabitans rhizophilus]|uniref:Glycoside hydrolase family 19 protein n=1 Tax=Terrihabitans rhizophilus TaxID=3092662 RepID=A0ABU4RSD2_9HYPH|nr:glycoside hydrolase family 19 protein [Terrihabitans sp. PJ23]MDX6806590.1 glycoside hydrolase family 19 protein [Terrihabitans sp. PJ23]